MNINIYIHVNIFKMYIACVCIFIYIINIHSDSTHIYYVNKLLFWMRLIAIHRLTALIIIHFFSILDFW